MTTRPGAAKNWLFTLNNYTEDERTAIIDLKPGNFDYLIIGRETAPTTGTRHLQGFFSLKTRLRLQPLKNLIGIPRIHLQIADGTAYENYEYCSKDGDFEEWGPRPTGKKRNRDELAVYYDKLVRESGNDGITKFREEHPGVYAFSGHTLLRNQQSAIQPKVRVGVVAYWVWGDTGTGKSHSAWARFPQSYSKEPKHKWWSGYLGEDTVIIDDFGQDNIDITLLLRWFDKYPTSVETKGGQMGLHATKFVVTSNFPPSHIYAGHVQLPALIRRLTIIEKLSVDDDAFPADA